MEAAHWALHVLSLVVIGALAHEVNEIERKRARLRTALKRRMDGVNWEQGEQNMTSVSGHDAEA